MDLIRKSLLMLSRIGDGFFHEMDGLFNLDQFFKSVGKAKLPGAGFDQVAVGVDTEVTGDVDDPGLCVAFGAINRLTGAGV